MKTQEAVDRTRTHDLTIEEIKACPVFTDFTDSQAQEVIETLKLFTKIAYDYYKKETKNHGNIIENS